ncbi:MAG: flavodoxin family protein [Syntrophorhabdaceae bacterium]
MTEDRVVGGKARNKEESNAKNVLGLIASPRALGNCETFAKEVSRHIPEAHTLRLIRLTSLDIGACRACYGCIMGAKCPIDDDMDFLLDELAGADAVIIASPVYYLGANAIIKSILDRGFLFLNILEKTYGKPALLFNFFGIPGRIGMAPQMLETFAMFLGFSVKASLSIQAALPGEALMEEKNLRHAKQLGKLLFSDHKIRPDSGCPFCGCQIVRIEGRNLVCTVCHGTFTMSETGQITKKEASPIMGSPEHMLLHREWLRGMKQRFLDNRKQIVKTIVPYKDIGEWIKPKKKQ